MIWITKNAAAIGFFCTKAKTMNKRILFLLILLANLPLVNYAQHGTTYMHIEKTHHDEMPHLRAAVLIGHTLIPAEHAGEHFFIPSWGLDIEYWFSKKWGVGLHSDLELETFVILKERGADEELERISPLVLTLDALYRPWKGLVIQFGPGLEFEKEENFPLIRGGLEYEFELSHHWDIAPTVFYDTRFSEYHTWSVALGIGKRF